MATLLIDPEFVHAVERENVRRLLVECQLERIHHFEGRIRDLGLTPRDYAIVILNVDDSNGAALADILMPGFDWSAIRASGQIAFARGLASRPALQGVITGLAAAAELAAIDGVAILAMHRGIITAFSLSELTR